MALVVAWKKGVDDEEEGGDRGIAWLRKSVTVREDEGEHEIGRRHREKEDWEDWKLDEDGRE